MRGGLTHDSVLTTCLMWQVDDFDWLKAQQSPHWSVIPEDERKTYVIGE